MYLENGSKHDRQTMKAQLICAQLDITLVRRSLTPDGGSLGGGGGGGGEQRTAGGTNEYPMPVDRGKNV